MKKINQSSLLLWWNIGLKPKPVSVSEARNFFLAEYAVNLPTSFENYTHVLRLIFVYEHLMIIYVLCFARRQNIERFVPAVWYKSYFT